MRSFALLAVAALAAGCGSAHDTTTPPPPAPDMLSAPDMPEAAPLTLTTMTLPEATQNVPYTATLTATGAHAGAAKWAITDGSLPPGLALDSTTGPSVRLVGTPTTGGSSTFTVALSDSIGEHVSRAFTLTVGDALAIAGTLPGATEGTPFAATLTSAGGHGQSFTWAVTAGALPSGLTIAAQGASTTISGTPQPGTATFTITLSDDAGETATRAFTLHVLSSLTITAGTMPSAVQGQAFSLPLDASGGLGTYQWSLSGNVPPGLALGSPNGNANTLAGTLVSAGTFVFTVGITDDNLGSASLTVTVTVTPALQIDTTHLANGQIGAPYSASLTAQGGVSSAYQWAVTSGALPPGLTLTAGSGDAPPASLSGTPTQIGNYSFTISVSTTAGDRSAQAFTMQIGNNPPHITTTSLPSGSWSTAYSASIDGSSAAGGAVTWALVGGALPPGLALGTSSGTSLPLAGTPTLLGTYSFTVQMTDAGGSDEKQLSVTIGRRSGIEIVAAILPQARVGHAYSATIATRGATGNVAWSVTSGALPDGLTLASNGTSAVIGGTPATSGWAPFTLSAGDDAGTNDAVPFAIRVAPARLLVAAANASSLYVREVQARVPGAETQISLTGAGGVAAPELGFSPSGDWLQYVVPQDGSGNPPWPFYTADLRAATLPGLVQPHLDDQLTSSTEPLWSPDDVTVAALTPSGTQSIIDGIDFSGVAPATSRLSLGAADGQDSWPAWSPDGTRLAYVSANFQAIFIYSASGTITLPLPSGLGGAFWTTWNGNPWLPDGRGLVFESLVGTGFAEKTQLFYIDAIAGAQPLLLSDPSVSLSIGYTSPDGGSIVLLSSTTTTDSHGGSSIDLYAVDLSTKQLAPAVKINGATAREFFQVDWSPDSQQIALPVEYGVDPPMVLARAQFGVADPTPLALGSLTQTVDNKDHLGWSADSRHVLFIDRSAHLTELALDGSAPLTLGTDTVQQVWPVAASPRSYVYFANGIFGATLYYVSVAGGVVSPPQRLDVSDASSGTVAVSPTLDTVFFSSASNAIYMVDLSGATPGTTNQLFPSSGMVTRFALGD